MCGKKDDDAAELKRKRDRIQRIDLFLLLPYLISSRRRVCSKFIDAPFIGYCS
jgi:hypothetical protein